MKAFTSVFQTPGVMQDSSGWTLEPLECSSSVTSKLDFKLKKKNPLFDISIICSLFTSVYFVSIKLLIVKYLN